MNRAGAPVDSVWPAAIPSLRAISEATSLDSLAVSCATCLKPRCAFWAVLSSVSVALWSVFCSACWAPELSLAEAVSGGLSLCEAEVSVARLSYTKGTFNTFITQEPAQPEYAGRTAPVIRISAAHSQTTCTQLAAEANEQEDKISSCHAQVNIGKKSHLHDAQAPAT